MNDLHTPLYGEALLHEGPGGELIEFRRDHALNPDLRLEWRYLYADGTPYKSGDAGWIRVLGDDWNWIGQHCYDVYQELLEQAI